MLHVLLIFKEVFSVVFFTYAHLICQNCLVYATYVKQFAPLPYSLTPGTPSVPMALSQTVTIQISKPLEGHSDQLLHLKE